VRVVLDTSIWVRYLRRGSWEAAEALNALLDAGAVLACGPVVAELLMGTTPHRREDLWLAIGSLPWADLDHEGWRLAGEVAGQLRASGLALPLTDVEIAAATVRADAALWTVDGDFGRIASAVPSLGLELYEPGRDAG
jgi:predicted nucleic acid-binding protein